MGPVLQMQGSVVHGERLPVWSGACRLHVLPARSEEYQSLCLGTIASAYPACPSWWGLEPPTTQFHPPETQGAHSHTDVQLHTA